MNWQLLDDEIKHLALLIHRACNALTSERDDKWALVTSQSNLIQEAFNTGIAYPSKQLREGAWAAFNVERNKGRAHYREYRRINSEQIYSDILVLLKHAHYDSISGIFDKTLFICDSTTRDDMIEKGRSLAEARRHLSTKKSKMLLEHKEDCHRRIIEIQNNHEAWWDARRVTLAKRKEEYETRQRQWEEEKSLRYKAKISSNLAVNRERLKKNQSALESMKKAAEDLQNKIDAAWNETWKAKAEVWLQELEEKIENTDNYKKRLEEWIEQDEENLREL